ncbi:hypothetical protein GGTG_12652 [Gaeumannomyces tritici R3-111a-1]|uniref:Uncharacterized protein n=1 Tax=Gaeumannomyces tritici (strain R3-111a-1) TaxID=644352 RepID=J3PGM3_GAET3|nr:hypothetical protein GGTG_12652 [Gaeumannomyces tritici R3-111a-1]EJT69769.1 hypothetical protein GGTG_12652 [Gaeumannomyces tritici R3-111a-1]
MQMPLDPFWCPVEDGALERDPIGKAGAGARARAHALENGVLPEPGILETRPSRCPSSTWARSFQ